jgi:hypothetical protein
MSYIAPKTNFKASDYYNYTDLNRMASNIQFIADLLRDSGYKLELYPFDPDFAMNSLPYLQVINNLEENLDRLRLAIPLVPRDYLETRQWYHTDDPRHDRNPMYLDANRWEENIELLRKILVSLREDWLSCGTFFSGEDYEEQYFCGGDAL